MTRFALVILALTAVVITTASAIRSASSNSNINLHSEFPPGLQLIAVAGSAGNGLDIADVDVMSISSNTHTIGARLPTKTSGFGSAMLNGIIYVVGGDTDNGAVSSFYAYNVAANRWTKLRDFPLKVSTNAAVAVGDAIYSFGGYAEGYGYMNYTYKYDVNKRVWSKVATALPVITMSPCALVDQSNNNIYYLHSGDLYRSSDGANTWKQLSSMNIGRNNAACALLPKSGQILVAGGGGDRDTSTGSTNSTELYDTATDTWKTVASMNGERDSARAVVIPGGDDVIVCGGENFYELETLADCELYSVAKNQWSVLDVTLNGPRHSYGLFATQV